MRAPRQRPGAVVAALSLAVPLLLSACGGAEPPVALPTAASPAAPATSDPDATTSAARSTDEATTSTATAAPTDEPAALGADGEPFDAGADAGAASTSDGPGSTRDADERVAAVQAWAEGYAHAATENDPDYAPWLDTMTEKAAALRQTYFDGDLGQRYPGPLPFTVTQKVDRDGGSIVEACVMSEGFSIPRGGTMSSQVVVPVEFHLKRDGGDLLVDGVYRGGVDCRTVLVEGKPW